MPLQFSLIDLPLYGGIDQQSDELFVQPGSLLEAQNCESDQMGSLIKRRTLSALPVDIIGGGTIQGVRRAARHGAEHLVIAEGNARCELFSEADSKWARRGDVCQPQIQSTPILSDDRSVLGCTSLLYADGKYLIAWTVFQEGVTYGSLYYKIIDQATGATIVGPTFVELIQGGSNALFPNGCVCGTTAVFVNVNQANNARAHTVDLSDSNLTLNSYTLAAVPVNSIVRVVGINSTEIIECHDTAGGTVMQRRTVSTMVATVTSPALGAGFVLVDFAGDATTVWQLVYNGVNTALAAFNATTLAVLGGPGVLAGMPTDLTGVLSPINSSTCLVSQTGATAYPAPFAGTSSDAFYRTYDTTIAPVWANIVTAPNSSPASRAFAYNGELYQFFILPDLTELDKNNVPTYRLALCRILDDASNSYKQPVLISSLFVQRGSATIYSTFTSLAAIRAGYYAWPSTSYRQWLPESGPIAGVDIVEFDWQTLTRHPVQTLGPSLHLGGGQIELYDRTQVIEHGFVHGPDILELFVNAGAGFAAGTYLYAAVYEWTDDDGQLHRSAPGRVYSWVNPGVNAAPSLYVRSIWCTNRQRYLQASKLVRIVLYRSLINTTQMYRVASISNAPQSAGVRFIAFPVAGYTYTDTTNPQDGYIYTEGGRLESRKPPPSLSIASVGNRLWSVNGEDSRECWFTNEYAVATAPDWNPELSVRVEDSRTGITAVAGLDGRTILFTRDAVYQVFGSGPTSNGVGAFSPPQRLSAPTGCDSPSSIVETQDGLFWANGSTIYFMNRGLSTSVFSNPVQTLIGSYPSVIAGVVDAKNERVLWLCHTSDASDSIILCYDLHKKIWYHWTTPVFIYSIIMDRDGAFAWADTATLWQVNNLGRDYDGTNYYWAQMQVVTPWYRVGSYQGWQRVRVAGFRGEYSGGSHTLNVAIAYDNESFSQTGQWTDADLQALPEFPVLRLEQLLLRQRCALVRFRVRDIENGSTADVRRGSKFIGITLTVGQKSGRQRLSTDRRK